MPVVLTNNATTRLAVALSSGATTLTVTTGEGSKFPSPTGGDWFPLTILNGAGALEIVRCTGRASDVLTIVRAREGTTALAFSIGDRVELRLTVASLGVLGQGPAFHAAGTIASQSISSSTFTKVALPLEIFDTANAFDATTNYRFQPTVPGYYQFSGAIRFTATASGLTTELVALYGTNALLGITANELMRGSEISLTRVSAASQGCVSGILYMNGTTDYVELWGWMTGSSLGFLNSAAGSRCYLQGNLVRAA